MSASLFDHSRLWRPPTNQVLILGRETLVLLQVVVEVFEIGAEAGDRAGGDEAVDLHLAIHANPQIPRMTSQGDLGSRLADRVDITNPSEPDHELVVAAAVGMVGVHRGEDVVGHVGADVGGVV